MTRWQLDHVQLAIPVGAEELCDGFYVGLLGFAVQTKPPVLELRGGRWYRRDDVQVHLGVEGDFRPARKAHPALAIDGYDDLLERLRAAEVEVLENDEIAGTRRCHVLDPVGNRIELIDVTTVR
ncbi:MAG: glyoxalase [Acidimicrobiaceae bacterium]|nr:glyoxalase [Acidimicrobiaceae bacterium]